MDISDEQNPFDGPINELEAALKVKKNKLEINKIILKI